MSLSVPSGSHAPFPDPARANRPVSRRQGLSWNSPAIDFGASFPPRLKRNSDCVPTPPEVASRMIELLDVKPGMKVLEPSAGTGNIADEIGKCAGVSLDVVELDSELRETLRDRGHNVVGSDFMIFRAHQYDRIIMNPPFSKGGHEEAQCILHVKHAYNLLAPGGKLAAIVPDWLFNTRGNGRRPREFVSWLENQTGGFSTHTLESGTFDNDESSTPVTTRILVIHKPEAANRNRPPATQLDLIA